VISTEDDATVTKPANVGKGRKKGSKNNSSADVSNDHSELRRRGHPHAGGADVWQEDAAPDTRLRSLGHRGRGSDRARSQRSSRVQARPVCESRRRMVCRRRDRLVGGLRSTRPGIVATRDVAHVAADSLGGGREGAGALNILARLVPGSTISNGHLSTMSRVTGQVTTAQSAASVGGSGNRQISTLTFSRSFSQ
jgi:hypothetical protein